MRRLRVLRAARHVFADAVRVCRALDPDYARRMADAYRALIQRARRLPKIGTLEPGLSTENCEVRRHLLRRYHHKVIIADAADELVVVAVVHKSRPPGYWHERLIASIEIIRCAWNAVLGPS